MEAFENHILIVDDDPASRMSLRAIVEAMNVTIHEFDSADALLNSNLSLRPACLITDQRMPGMGGVQLIEELRRRNVNFSIIVLTAFPDTRSTVRAMQSRALTLLEKPCNPQELWDAIQHALKIDTENYLQELDAQQSKQRLDCLTEGELAVLGLMMEGLANKVIANRLDVSLRTVEGRRASIFEKLEVDSIPELTIIWHNSKPR